MHLNRYLYLDDTRRAKQIDMRAYHNDMREAKNLRVTQLTCPGII